MFDQIASEQTSKRARAREGVVGRRSGGKGGSVKGVTDTLELNRAASPQSHHTRMEASFIERNHQNLPAEKHEMITEITRYLAAGWIGDEVCGCFPWPQSLMEDAHLNKTI
jgi:polyphosphate kinase 2 (PPK2 family)